MKFLHCASSAQAAKAPHRTPLRTHRRFRLSFINENTFTEIWTIHMSQRKVILASLLLLVAVGCMVGTLIVLTPLRTLLPGYLRSTERHENITNVLRIDSVLDAARTASAYLDNIATLLRGDSAAIHPVPAPPITDQSLINPDSLIGASEAEQALVKAVEERRSYTVDSRRDTRQGIPLFHLPVSDSQQIPSPTPDRLILRASRNSTVTAPAPATVIYSGYSPSDLWTVLLQHPNGYVTSISGITSTNHLSPGQALSAGEALGSVGDRHDITIRLWSGGIALEPLRFMVF